MTPICIEPVTFDNTVPVGFTHAPGGKKYANNSILCYHYYKPPALGLSTIYARIRDGKRLKMASLLSEFHGGEDNVDAISIAEENGQSWLFWDFKDFGKNWGSTSNAWNSDVVNSIKKGMGLKNALIESLENGVGVGVGVGTKPVPA